MAVKIALVDDDAEMLSLISNYLSAFEFELTSFANGIDFLSNVATLNPQLIILDVMMPGMTGLQVCQQLRAQQNFTPILMLTALSDEVDCVVGLEIGADDYLTKPFSPRALLARVRALVRRGAQQLPVSAGKELVYEFEGWQLEKNRRRLFSPTQIEISLTSNEFELLLLLLQTPNQVISRDDFLDHFKGREAHAFDRSIDIQMSRLRQKIEANPKQPALIKTIRSAGYMLTAEVKLKSC